MRELSLCLVPVVVLLLVLEKKPSMRGKTDNRLHNR